MIGRTGRRQQRKACADARYGEIVAYARCPAFYREGAVPDTLDGRFDMLSLVLTLYLEALERTGTDGMAFSQAVQERFFADMDRGLREMGVGDMSVGKQIKRMARAFFGRRQAYGAALAMADDAALHAALARNVYRGAPAAGQALQWLAGQVRALAAALAAAVPARLVDGPLPLGAVPA
ncbi:MAG: ubiquinol-cytochrome C chaperone [Alphaproteobacteria bacterium]|nr:MAG: ubiquinol-cytochrome C chaperone [Alphaproteobacteria bacterium]